LSAGPAWIVTEMQMAAATEKRVRQRFIGDVPGGKYALADAGHNVTNRRSFISQNGHT
jgi:hypothetical protein